MSNHAKNKFLLEPLRKAQYNFEEGTVRTALESICTTDTTFNYAYPLSTTHGVDDFYETAFAPLLKAWPDLERRDHIVMAGTDDHGYDWVGCGGFFTGTSFGPWLDIPPDGHQSHMRFHEFYRFVEGKVVEVQALWDIPEVMMQSRAWPMPPSLGREWHVPGPATLDGLQPNGANEIEGIETKGRIVEMLEHLKKHPSQGGPEVMEMERFWHPRMSWYGPSGIGTGRGIAGFRHWHQIPFINAMPNRGLKRHEITYHFFGERNYAAVTGWPNMIQSISHDGWMGIAPTGKEITMKSLDFWRLEDGLIRENWVMVDILDAYQQLGVDVLGRMREFNKARNIGPLSQQLMAL